MIHNNNNNNNIHIQVFISKFKLCENIIIQK